MSSADLFFVTEHEHFLDTQDGDKICLDICTSNGRVISVGWYTLHTRNSGRKEFPIAA